MVEKTRNPFGSQSPLKSPSKSKTDDLALALDLDIFNYLCVVLLEGRGLPEYNKASLEDLRQEYYLDDEETLKRTEYHILGSNLHPSIVGRFTIYEAAVLVEWIQDFIAQTEQHDNLEKNELFPIYTEASGKFAKLAKILEGNSLLDESDREKTSFQTLYVQLKTLEFATKLHAGFFTKGKYTNYPRAAANSLLNEIFEIPVNMEISEAARARLASQLDAARNEIKDGISRGEVENYLEQVEDKISHWTKYLSQLFNRVNELEKPALYEPVEEEEERDEGMWTDEETDILAAGLREFGHNWKGIAAKYPELGRTPMQLKDRARSVRKIKEARKEPLGDWEIPRKK